MMRQIFSRLITQVDPSHASLLLKSAEGSLKSSLIETWLCGQRGMTGPSVQICNLRHLTLGTQCAARTKPLWRRCFSTLTADAPSMSQAAAAKAASVRGGLVDGLSCSARKQLAWWLGGSSVWVFSLVVLGGITRLTRSGLSMTDWKFAGERSPVSQADWEAEFSRYQLSPEFRKVHIRMTLEEFKFIFWMEYAHRMWARALGIIFAVPGAYFLARGYITRPLAKRLGLLFLMGGTQGLVGWWMVRSGLQEPAHEHAVPRVSPYRLAAHLLSAFTIYSLLVWTTLGVMAPAPALAQAGTAVQKAAWALRGRLLPLALLVGVTATSGAFVAGLDAGRAFNTFPLMAGKWIPDEYFHMTGLRNAFENTAAVQLHHRVLAVSTLTGVLGVWAYGRGLPLLPSSRALLNATAGMTCLQVAMGITALLTYVPVSLGSAHQAGALALFTLVLGLLHSVRPVQPSAAARLLSRAAMPAALLGVAGVAVAVTQTQ